MTSVRPVPTRLTFGGDYLWLLQDPAGIVWEVIVEPAVEGIHAVGDRIAIDGETFELVAIRRRWVQGVWREGGEQE